MESIDWTPLLAIGGWILGAMAFALLLAILLMIYSWRKVKKMNIPPDAGFAETLALTPLPVVLMIDMFDLALDFMSVPVVWFVLDRMGLKALRGISAVEAFIPGTQLIPTMTLAWLGMKVFGINPTPRHDNTYAEGRGNVVDTEYEVYTQEEVDKLG